MWFQRFRADGTAESAATPISYQAPRWAQPALASNGSRFALSCYTPDGAVPRTRAWLIGADGALNSASGVGYNDLPPTSLFWDGARFRGFSTASGGLGARTVPSTQVTLSAAGDAFTTAALPALSDRGFYGPRPSQAALVGGVAFVDTSSSGVFGLSRLDAASARLDPLPIAFGGSNEYGRAFGTDGTVLLGVWDASETSLRGARISRDGDILDAASWNLSHTPPGGAPEPFTPIAIAHGAGVWSVLGSSGFVGGSFRLRVRQVNASGTVLRSIALPATALPIYASSAPQVRQRDPLERPGVRGRRPDGPGRRFGLHG
ncbi:MAG: hypothetical protein IPN17_22225 [Deltaproteobacteria bacterium]|nr:hypothetical protein [Deltaproteobacteria bacterium]